jgi:ketosteroid isomerase-like protein
VSEENVEIVRGIYDAARQRDADAVLSLYDPSVECDYSRVRWGDPARRGVYHGHEGLQEVFREWHEAWENYEAGVDEVIDVGDDQVITVGTARGRGRASGIEVELRHQAGLWTIRGGKVVRVVWFPTREEAFEAAELAQREENVETVHRLAAAVSRRDLPQVLELTDPQVEWRPFIAALTESRHYRGHDGIRQYLSDLDETFETFRTNIDDLLGVGDVVVGVGHIQYRGKGSGIETEMRVGWVFKLREGKVLQVRAFREPEKALDQVGPSG